MFLYGSVCHHASNKLSSLTSFPIFENPYPIDIHESPVTCTEYFADCPPDLIPVLYSVGAKHKKQGYSNKVNKTSIFWETKHMYHPCLWNILPNSFHFTSLITTFNLVFHPVCRLDAAFLLWFLMAWYSSLSNIYHHWTIRIKPPLCRTSSLGCWNLWDRIDLKECCQHKIWICLKMLSVSKTEIVYKMIIMQSRRSLVQFEGWQHSIKEGY